MNMPVLIYAVMTTFHTYVQILLYRNFLHLKRSPYALYLAYLLMNLSDIVLAGWYLNADFMMVRGIVYTLLDLLAVCLFFEDTLLKKIFVFSENVLVLMIVEMVSQQIFFNILHFELADFQITSYIKSIGMFITTVIYLILDYFLIYFQKRNIHFLLSEKKIILLIVYSLTQFIFMVLMIGTLWIRHMELSRYFIFIPVVSILSIMYLLQIFSLMEMKEQTEKSIRYMKEQSELAMHYYEKIADRMESLEVLQGEYAEKLQNIYIVSGIRTDSKEQSSEQKNRQSKEQSNEQKNRQNKEQRSEQPKRNQNILVSKIVSNVKMQLDALHCSYHIQLDIPQSIKIKQIDLTGLLINLFDNAIEAIAVCRQQEAEAEVLNLEAVAEYQNEQLTISVRNSKSPLQKIRKLDNKYATTKQNKEVHGYGLQIIEKIAKEYGGGMQVRYSSNWFENKVTLKV